MPPKTGYERVRDHRDRVLSAGGDRLDMLLPARSARLLGVLAILRGKSRSAVVIDLIETAASDSDLMDAARIQPTPSGRGLSEEISK